MFIYRSEKTEYFNDFCSPFLNNARALFRPQYTLCAIKKSYLNEYVKLFTLQKKNVKNTKTRFPLLMVIIPVRY